MFNFSISWSLDEYWIRRRAYPINDQNFWRGLFWAGIMHECVMQGMRDLGRHFCDGKLGHHYYAVQKIMVDAGAWRG